MCVVFDNAAEFKRSFDLITQIAFVCWDFADNDKPITEELFSFLSYFE